MKLFAVAIAAAAVSGVAASESELKLDDLARSSVQVSESTPWRQFEKFASIFNKTYVTVDEKLKRYSVFLQNMGRADELNKLSNSSAHGVTKFSDMSREEFSKYLGFKPKDRASSLRASIAPRKEVYATMPRSVDWRKTGAVSPIKNQGQCGSCWAFSATEAIETGVYFSDKKSLLLAPQQITSCDTQDMGCEGGDTLTAYQYVQQAGGIDAETDYPYTSGNSGMNGKCWGTGDKKNFKAKITKVEAISHEASGETLMYTEIKNSPMSICVDAESWQTYTGGIVTSKTCGTELDHCVQVVGIDAEQGFWIVKNQWGTDWGEDGYIRVKTGENACGIALEATTVTATTMSEGEEPDHAIFV